MIWFEQEVQELELELAVKEENRNVDAVLQDVVADNETSEVTLNVISKDLKESIPLEFTLTGIPANTTLTSEDSITGNLATNGDLKVSVPAEIGNYSFTLTNDGKVKNVTVHVVDATMPTKITFQEIREDDVNTVEDEIVKSISYELKPISVEDAKIKLSEKKGNIFFTFVNIDTGKVNVIFKLKDSNNYGLVEPEE